MKTIISIKRDLIAKPPKAGENQDDELFYHYPYNGRHLQEIMRIIEKTLADYSENFNNPIIELNIKFK